MKLLQTYDSSIPSVTVDPKRVLTGDETSFVSLLEGFEGKPRASTLTVISLAGEMKPTCYVIGGEEITQEAYLTDREKLSLKQSEVHEKCTKNLPGWSKSFPIPDDDLRIYPPSTEVQKDDEVSVHQCLGVTEKGLMNTQTYIRTLRKISAELNGSPSNPIILFVDGHNMHVSLEVCVFFEY